MQHFNKVWSFEDILCPLVSRLVMHVCMYGHWTTCPLDTECNLSSIQTLISPLQSPFQVDPLTKSTFLQ